MQDLNKQGQARLCPEVFINRVQDDVITVDRRREIQPEVKQVSSLFLRFDRHFVGKTVLVVNRSQVHKWLRFRQQRKQKDNQNFPHTVSFVTQFIIDIGNWKLKIRPGRKNGKLRI